VYLGCVVSKKGKRVVYVNKSVYGTLDITLNIRGEVWILFVAPDVC